MEVSCCFRPLRTGALRVSFCAPNPEGPSLDGPEFVMETTRIPRFSWSDLKLKPYDFFFALGVGVAFFLAGAVFFFAVVFFLVFSFNLIVLV
jgi:hypothetical protein